MSSDILLSSRLDEFEGRGQPEEEELRQGGSSPPAEVTEQLNKKKRPRRSLNPDHLVGPAGFKRIYEEFPLECKLIEGSEVRSLRKLMDCYRAWAFDLHPGMSFSDMLDSIETHSTKGQVRACISELRDRERARFMVSNCTVTSIHFNFCYREKSSTSEGR